MFGKRRRRSRASETATADQQKLNEAHDAIVAAGAECENAQKDAMAKAAGLAKANDALTSENKILKAELAELKARPEPMKGKILALGKNG